MFENRQGVIYLVLYLILLHKSPDQIATPMEYAQYFEVVFHMYSTIYAI